MNEQKPVAIQDIVRNHVLDIVKDYEDSETGNPMTMGELKEIHSKYKNDYESSWKKALIQFLDIAGLEWMQNLPKNLEETPFVFRDFSVYLLMTNCILPQSIEDALYLDPIMTPEEEKNNLCDEDVLGFYLYISINGITNEENAEIPLDKMKHNLSSSDYTMSDSNTSIVYAMRNKMIDVIINYRKSASASIASNKMMEYYKSGVDAKFNESIDIMQRLSDRVYTGDMTRKLTESSGFFYTKLQATFSDISNSDTVISDEEKEAWEYIESIFDWLHQKATNYVLEETQMYGIEPTISTQTIAIGNNNFRYGFGSNRIPDVLKGIWFFLLDTMVNR